MAELSIVVPFVNEFPQIVFTIRALAEEVLDRVDFEIIAINNYCDEVKEQDREQDKGADALKAAAGVNKWLKVLEYKDSLSHWQAKNLGVLHSTGKFLFFADGHVSPARDSLYPMFQFYRENHEELNGSIHLPLTYQILESRKLVYTPVVDLSIGKFSYRFASYQHHEKPFKIPCMSTCGLLFTREIYDRIGGWPANLGIYGGGEPFLNYTAATMGLNKWIWNGKPLHHFGERRGYSWNYTNWLYNECLACFFIGGEAYARKLMANARGRREVLDYLLNDVLTDEENLRHKGIIDRQRVMTIEEWWGLQSK
jgi:glycosyltransferase involved in cell wall biosynthesis